MPHTLLSIIVFAFFNLPISLLANVDTPTAADTKRSYRFTLQSLKPRVAIIIDDIGYNIPLGQRTVNLPGALTLAVLPKPPGAVSLAKAGFTAGKEIILHAPMSNHHDKKLGPGGLTEQLSEIDFKRTLNQSIDSVPHAVGVNNHMGSKLTTQSQPMQWVMEILAARNMYFIDSVTHGESVAYQTARRLGIVTSKRDIFLDNDVSELAISRQFDKLIRLARLQGYAIAIGHPYQETLNILEQRLPELQQHNIDLIHISKLLNFKTDNTLASNP